MWSEIVNTDVISVDHIPFIEWFLHQKFETKPQEYSCGYIMALESTAGGQKIFAKLRLEGQSTLCNHIYVPSSVVAKYYVISFHYIEWDTCY